MQALVTGEGANRVSSQTLTNLRLIDNVSDTLILRPPISTTKSTSSIWRAKSALKILPVPCQSTARVISKSPTVKAVKAKIEAEEEHLISAFWIKWWKKVQHRHP